jgi:UDP-glucose 6-dehydrogenase
MRVAIVGYGKVGSAYHKMFPEAVIYDPFKEEHKATTKEQVNECDVAIVAVFTPLKEDGSLDISIVEEVVGWIDCKLIIIKSALMPGTTDHLIKKTGKRIAISVEYVGEGNYPVHFWKYPDQNDPRLHSMLVVGGYDDVAQEAAEVLWSKMSPDIKIHLVTPLEAEITKLVENSYGALKVTFINTLLSLAKKSGTNFIRIHQAWQSDPRTDSMHLRAVGFKRGWASKCWSKDIPALAKYSRDVGALDMAKLFDLLIKLNEEHLGLNEKD